MKHNYLTQEQLESKWFKLVVPYRAYDDYNVAGLCARVGFGEPIFPAPPRNMVGYFFVDKPFHREEVLHDVKFVYSDYEIQRVGEREGLVCKMRIRKKSQHYLFPVDFKDIEQEAREHILELVKRPPTPHLDVWYDEIFSYYRARILEKDVEAFLE